MSHHDFDTMLSFLEDLTTQAKRLGASHAEAVTVQGTSVSAEVRLGKVEGLEHAESGGYGLRVCFGKRQAYVSSSDYRPEAIRPLVERAVAMAQATPEDPFLCMADPKEFATSIPELDLYDSCTVSAATLLESAMECEAAALAVKGVTNSEGASASTQHAKVAMVLGNGFSRHYNTSSYSLSASVLAASEQGMETDYAYSAARHYEDLTKPGVIGVEAGERAVKKLNPRKIATTSLPVIFEPRVARGILGALASAANGAAIARGTSFLKNKMGEQICAPNITIIDEPHRVRGLGSVPVDGEGLFPEKMALVENGVLKNWLLDLRTALQLNLRSNGRASRGIASSPSPSSTNLYMMPGSLSRDQLLAETGTGLYITGLSGMGVNLITGDYSQGATGFMIENGVLTYPVSEVTIAGTLQEMLNAMTAADDLAFIYGTNAPTLRFASMKIAGL